MAKRTVNKTAFINNQPLSMSASEVVAVAKKKGIKISEKYVYNARAKARSSGGGNAKRKPGRPAGSKNGVITHRVRADSGAVELTRDESVFANMAIDMGLGRAEELLKRVRDSIKSALA